MFFGHLRVLFPISMQAAEKRVSEKKKKHSCVPTSDGPKALHLYFWIAVLWLGLQLGSRSH